MGKVKFVEQFRDYVEEKVSIPYGKGKENAITQLRQKKRVSIPYGKGKEQHLVLCFYYNT